MKQVHQFIAHILVLSIVILLFSSMTVSATDIEEIETEKNVTGIAGYDLYESKAIEEYVIALEECDEIEMLFPATIAVYLNYSEEVVEIPVEWELSYGKDRTDIGLNAYRVVLQKDYEWSDELEYEFYHNGAVIPYVTVEVIERREISALSYSPSDLPSARIGYKVHCQSYGDRGWAYQGGSVGTEGEGKRIEAIYINISNNSNLGVQYRVYLDGQGWTAWASNGAMCGTTGQALAIQQLQVRLTGSQAAAYNLRIRVHSQTAGWVDQTAVGTKGIVAGTVGKRLEMIQMFIVPNFHARGTGYHTTTCSGCMSDTCTAPIQYQSAEGYTINTYAWKEYTSKCASCNSSYRLYLWLTDYYTGCIHYSSYARRGWDLQGQCEYNGGYTSMIRDGNRTMNAGVSHTRSYCPGHNTANTYTVIYKGNGNTGGSMENSAHTYDAAKALSANGFTKTGYSFAGWATSETGPVVYRNGASVKNLTSVNGGNVYLYAKWEPENRTVTITCKISVSDMWKEHGDVTFIFKLAGNDEENIKHTYYRSVTIDEEYALANVDGNGFVSVQTNFSDIIPGEYIVTEEQISRWRLKAITDVENGSISESSVVFDLINQETAYAVFVNEKYEWQWYSDSVILH